MTIRVWQGQHPRRTNHRSSPGRWFQAILNVSTTPFNTAFFEVPTIHDRTDFQARQERHAIGQGCNPGVAARLRAGAAAVDRTVDGLDLLARYEAAADASVSHYGRGRRLL